MLETAVILMLFVARLAVPLAVMLFISTRLAQRGHAVG